MSITTSAPVARSGAMRSIPLPRASPSFLFLDNDKFAAAICRSPPATSGHGSQGRDSLPLAKLLEWSILALEMNGEPLHAIHP